MEIIKKTRSNGTDLDPVLILLISIVNICYNKLKFNLKTFGIQKRRALSPNKHSSF